jgi:hypothetical protein
MFVHIVFWRLTASAPNGKSKQENAIEMQRQFHALRGVVSGLLRCDFGIDSSRTEESADVALYMEFESQAAYDGYVVHPAHKAIVSLIKELKAERRVVDYDQS